MTTKLNLSNYFYYFTFLIFLLFVFNVSYIYANDAGAPNPQANEEVDILTKGLCNLIYVFSSGFGKGVAIISLSVLGITVIQGQIKWTTFVTYGTGIILIIGPAQIFAIVYKQVDAGEANAIQCGIVRIR